MEIWIRVSDGAATGLIGLFVLLAAIFGVWALNLFPRNLAN